MKQMILKTSHPIITQMVKHRSMCLECNLCELISYYGKDYSLPLCYAFDSHYDRTKGESITDILTQPQTVEEIVKILNVCGYVQGFYESGKIILFTSEEILDQKLNYNEIAPFVKLSRNNEFPFVQVHVTCSLGNNSEELSGLVDEMIIRRKVYHGKISLPILERTYFFLQLILSQYKNNSSLFIAGQSIDLELYKLADIFYLWERGAYDKHALKEIACFYDVGQKIGAVLAQVGTIFNSNGMLEEAKIFW